MSLTPVVNNRSSSSALGGIAALTGATLQTGYQLTPARMVELIKSRAVLSGVGFSSIKLGGRERIIDRILGERYERNDAEEVAKQIDKRLTTETSKETGTILVAIQHPDSAIARLTAERVVDSASQIFVRTSKAQAQQLRIAQEARVDNAATALASAEERLRQFNDENRATPPYSAAGLRKIVLTAKYVLQRMCTRRRLQIEKPLTLASSKPRRPSWFRTLCQKSSRRCASTSSSRWQSPLLSV